MSDTSANPHQRCTHTRRGTTTSAPISLPRNFFSLAWAFQFVALAIVAKTWLDCAQLDKVRRPEYVGHEVQLRVYQTPNCSHSSPNKAWASETRRMVTIVYYCVLLVVTSSVFGWSVADENDVSYLASPQPPDTDADPTRTPTPNAISSLNPNTKPRKVLTSTVNPAQSRIRT